MNQRDDPCGHASFSLGLAVAEAGKRKKSI